jgi:hypothetical protein
VFDLGVLGLDLRGRLGSFAYLADTINRKAMRLKLGYTAEATCRIP